MSERVPRTEASLAVERLREEIVSGEMEPGSKLKLSPLSRRYEVSRGPLREAALRLAAEGLVELEDQKGFRVAPISHADLWDVTQTRQRIEVFALRDSIEHGDLEWEGRVMASYHVLGRVTEHDGSPEAYELFTAHHRTFHAVLVEACPSHYLLSFRMYLYQLTQRYRNLASKSYRSVRGGRDIVAEHRAIAEAAVKRDTEQACRLMEEHLGMTATMLVDSYPELLGGKDEQKEHD